jgi:hypothetical protein
MMEAPFGLQTDADAINPTEPAYYGLGKGLITPRGLVLLVSLAGASSSQQWGSS